jgi:hypothetical protein
MGLIEHFAQLPDFSGLYAQNILCTDFSTVDVTLDATPDRLQNSIV